MAFALLPNAMQRLERKKLQVDVEKDERARLERQEIRHEKEIQDLRQYIQDELNHKRDDYVALLARYDRLEAEMRDRLERYEVEKLDMLKGMHTLQMENAQLKIELKDMEGQQLVIADQNRRLTEQAARIAELESEVKTLQARLNGMQNGHGVG